MAEAMITVNKLYKNFKLPHDQASGLKQAIVTFYKRDRGYDLQKVLNDVSFEIKKGEFFGIVGRNGSGKSTLLKLLAGVYTPEQGSIAINGNLTPFIELGVGFNPELTGRENIFLNGALLGFDHKQMSKMYAKIVEFAELEGFMDQKLKNYSSGMQVRLAFSIAIRAESDVLLIDEVLAVGDAIFQKKCYDYFRKLKKDGRTVVFVSHDTAALQEYCDRGVLVEKGKVLTYGTIDEVIKDYLDLLNGTEVVEQTSEEERKSRWGNGEMTITEVRVLDNSDRQAKQLFTDDDIKIRVEVDFKANTDITRPIYGVTIKDVSGKIIFQSNTLWCDIPVKDVSQGATVTIRWSIPNSFSTDTFVVSPAASDSMGSQVLEWWDDAATFKVRKKQKSHGIINVPHELIVEEPL